jgi:hypothetical protein
LLNHLIGDESIVACRLQYHRLSNGEAASGDIGDGKGEEGKGLIREEFSIFYSLAQAIPGETFRIIPY